MTGSPAFPGFMETSNWLDPSHPVAGNLLEQDFTAEGVNKRWASDMAHIFASRHSSSM